MNAKIATLAAVVLLSACTYGGHYARSGPCGGWHTDQAACLRAHENSVAIGTVQVGQSIDEVRGIMGKDPDRRDATAATESWSYLTDYEGNLRTTIVFERGKVVKIEGGQF